MVATRSRVRFSHISLGTLSSFRVYDPIMPRDVHLDAASYAPKPGY